MNVSSSTHTPPTDIGSVKTEVLKKAIDVNEQSIKRLIDGADEQSKQVAAQKTGIGNNLNITG